LSGRDRQGIGMTSQRTRDRLVARLRSLGIRDERVLEVIRRTPRHLFVDEALASRAYENTALPIGFSQTISQPFIVARMTEALLAEGVPARVLEVGTGSGYQAAILAQLVGELYSVERIAALYRRAGGLLRELGLRNVRLRHSDGSWGWPKSGPYDAIMVTAAAEEIPDDLLAQLVVGGRMIAPVGREGGAQELKYIVRRDTQHWEQSTLGPASFVPLRQGEVR
jgi:protein-L-isoaspartate(D-aspartate) O-methyltransferase